MKNAGNHSTNFIGDVKSAAFILFLPTQFKYLPMLNPHTSHRTMAFTCLICICCSYAALAGGGNREYKKGHKLYYAQEYQQAKPLLESAAAKGNTDAMIDLGEMYRIGRLGPVDYVKAIHYLLPAAEAHEIEAMYNLYHIYADAKYPATYSKESAIRIATILYHIPATKDQMSPAYIAADAALLIHPLDRSAAAGADDTFAFLLAKKSALEGFVNGMEVLAYFYRDGTGVAPSNAAAIAWAKEAIAHGSDKCRYLLAQLTGTKPVFRDGDYRTIDAKNKELAAHPERQLTRADLPGGYVSSEESKAYDAWWEKTWGSGRLQGTQKTTSTTTQWGTPEKTARQRDQEMYDQMHREADAREKSYNEKWGR